MPRRELVQHLAIIGPGAIGGTVAAWLAQDKARRVSVCARTAIGQLTVATPHGTIIATPGVLLDPANATPADWILIATKTYDAEATARWLPALTGPATRLAVLQNGVEHIERFAPYMDPTRIVPAVVDIPAERTGPGEVRQRRDGTILVPTGHDGENFVALFAATPIAVSTIADFRTAAWRKLCLNSAGAVSALTLKPGGIAAFPPAAEVMRELVRECAAVGRAEGADLDEGLADEVVQGYRSGPADSINSMHADRIAGRPMEVDARNGVVVRLGRRHAIDTPVHRLVVALLEASMQLTP